MENKSSNRAELISWYLARLRNNARGSSLDRKLTPLTLVETDKSLIQEIVMQSQVNHEQKYAQILEETKKANSAIRRSQQIMSLVIVIAALFILAQLLI